ncbi:MAG: ribulose-phosphate 3-epimerase [Nitrospirae bacterium]|nr:ribulose-phosphate 3-epimerase [Nitrospirota bacterium]
MSASSSKLGKPGKPGSSHSPRPVRPVRIAPSILSADFSRLADEIQAVEAAGADLIHIDVMDGRFVPNLTVGPVVVEAARKSTRLPLDVHLMIVEPERLIPEFADAGSTYLTVHVETCPHLHRTLQMIKERGVKAGVTLNPSTPLNLVEPMLSEADLLLIMSVNPGFGGQRFIPQALEKVRQARAIIDARGLSVELEVDGGVKPDNVKLLAEAGATIFVAGSAIFGSNNYTETIRQMREAAGR